MAARRVRTWFSNWGQAPQAIRCSFSATWSGRLSARSSRAISRAAASRQVRRNRVILGFTSGMEKTSGAGFAEPVDIQALLQAQAGPVQLDIQVGRGQRKFLTDFLRG